jgi:hypothetical protein
MTVVDGSQEECKINRHPFAGTAPRLALALLVLSGCASQAPTPTQTAPTPANRDMNLAGYPPAFKSGYADGCSDAAGTTKKDLARFRADIQYAQGWRDGFDVCKRR